MRTRLATAGVVAAGLAVTLTLAACTSDPPSPAKAVVSTGSSSTASSPLTSPAGSTPAASTATVAAASADTHGSAGPESSALTTALASSGSDNRSGWLVLAYFSAANSLETAELSDLKESLAVSDPDVTELALVDRDTPATSHGQTDGRTDADTLPGIPEDPKGGTQLIQVREGKATLLANLPDQSMIDPGVMAQFISSGIQKFPNRKVAFVMDDHGGGWRGAEEDQETSVDGVMNLADIAKGVKDGVSAAGRNQLDVLGFDDCMMANLDVLTAVAPYTRRIVASADEEPNAGWDWGFLGQVTGAETPDQFGQKAVSAFRKYYSSQKILQSATLAVFDPTKIKPLNDALDAMVAGTTDNPSTVSAIATSRAQSWQYAQSSDPALNFNLIDLGNWAAKMQTAVGGDMATKAAAVIQAEKDTMTASYVDLLSPGATGVTVYFPPTGGTTSTDYAAANPTPGWLAFLNSYHEKVAAVPATNPFDTSSQVRAVAKQGQFAVQAAYLPAQEKNIADAVGRIGTDLGDGRVAYLIDGPADLKAGTVSAEGVTRYATVTDGSTTIPVSMSGVTALNIPFEYTAPNGTTQNVLISTVPNDADPTQLDVSQVYGDIANGTPSRTTLDPQGKLSPRYLIGKADGSSSWETDSSVSVSADVFNEKFRLPAVPVGKKIVVAITLTSLNGQSYTEGQSVTIQR